MAENVCICFLEHGNNNVLTIDVGVGLCGGRAVGSREDAINAARRAQAEWDNGIADPVAIALDAMLTSGAVHLADECPNRDPDRGVWREGKSKETRR